MKKLTLSMVAAFMLLSLFPMQLKAVTPSGTVPVDSTRTVESAEVIALTKRLEEINGMDKSKLTSPEKRQLRKEVRTIKKQASALSGGVYVSAGALIVLLILLIILL